jgi:hypothetical protein
VPFSKKRIYELDDVSSMTAEEREEAIISLEKRRLEVSAELEGLMRSYAKLTKKRSLRARKYKLGKAPNDYNSDKLR